jgi:hypothetical protein
VAREADGREIATAQTHRPFAVAHWTRLHAAAAVSAMVQWRGRTCHLTPIARVDVTLPGTSTAIPVPYVGDEPCYQDAGGGLFGVVWSFSPSRDANGKPWVSDDSWTHTAAGLIFMPVDVPGKVQPGGTLDYQLSASHAWDFPVSMEVCPAYQESLNDALTGALIASASFTLDCDGHRTVPPLTNVRYAMQMKVPPTVKPGTQLTLSVDVDARSTTCRIVRPSPSDKKLSVGGAAVARIRCGNPPPDNCDVLTRTHLGPQAAVRRRHAARAAGAVGLRRF